MTTFQKILSSADRVLAGTGDHDHRITSTDYEEALLKYANEQRQPGESDGAALNRLIDEQDPTVAKLWAATDTARLNEHHGQLLPSGGRDKRYVKQTESIRAAAETNLRSYVKIQQRSDETEAAAEARLITEDDSRYGELYTAYVESKRL